MLQKIIPLILDELDEQVSQIIELNQFDINERSEENRNILEIALCLNKQNIINSLIKHQQLHQLPIYHVKISQCLIDDIETTLPLIEKLQKNKQIIITKNFIEDCSSFQNTLQYKNDREKKSLTKLFLSFYSNQDINSDFSKESSIKIAQLNNKALFNFYLDSNKKPEHMDLLQSPTYQIFKNLLMDIENHDNFIHYYADIKQEQYIKISYKKFKKNISKRLENIKDTKSFQRFIIVELPDELENIPLKNRSAYGDIYHYVTRFLRKKENYVLIDDHEKFAKIFLVDFLIYFFDKHHALYNIAIQPNAFLQEQIQSMNFFGVSHHVNHDPNEIISLLKRFHEKTNLVFNSGHKAPIGFNDLVIQFNLQPNLDCYGHYSQQGAYHLINLFNLDNKRIVSTFIHEYTHYLQFSSLNMNNHLKPIIDEFKKYHPISSQQLIDLFNEYYFSLDESQQKKLKICIDESKTIDDFQYKITLSEYDQLNHVSMIKFFHMYYSNKLHQKESFEYHLLKNWDEDLQKIYYQKDIEIHANLSSSLIVEERVHQYKLTEMKTLISKMNEGMFKEHQNNKKLKFF